MKKICFLLVLIVSFLFPLSADVGWTPSFSAGVGIDSADYEYEGVSSGFLPVLALSAELDPISFRSGDEYISFPVSYQFVLDNNLPGNRMSGARHDFIFGLKYGHRFGSLFRLYVSGNIGYSAAADSWNNMWLFGGTVTPAFAISDNFMVQFPISAYAGGESIVIDARIMLALHFDVAGEVMKKQ